MPLRRVRGVGVPLRRVGLPGVVVVRRVVVPGSIGVAAFLLVLFLRRPGLRDSSLKKKSQLKPLTLKEPKILS